MSSFGRCLRTKAELGEIVTTAPQKLDIDHEKLAADDAFLTPKKSIKNLSQSIDYRSPATIADSKGLLEPLLQPFSAINENNADERLLHLDNIFKHTTREKSDRNSNFNFQPEHENHLMNEGQNFSASNSILPKNSNSVGFQYGERANRGRIIGFKRSNDQLEPAKRSLTFQGENLAIGTGFEQASVEMVLTSNRSANKNS
uniref:Uncharacterized protein n=1 Tax=Scherffelia dubia TaxID=3190 RepID=A0A142BYF5_SCHDU|nr:hypothetical protein [Scherffelia dubia]AMP43447.1 hypothetical protein [Scherffelia dubia]